MTSSMSSQTDSVAADSASAVGYPLKWQKSPTEASDRARLDHIRKREVALMKMILNRPQSISTIREGDSSTEDSSGYARESYMSLEEILEASKEWQTFERLAQSERNEIASRLTWST
jgi:hypothetical protein